MKEPYLSKGKDVGFSRKAGFEICHY